MAFALQVTQPWSCGLPVPTNYPATNWFDRSIEFGVACYCTAAPRTEYSLTSANSADERQPIYCVRHSIAHRTNVADAPLFSQAPDCGLRFWRDKTDKAKIQQ